MATESTAIHDLLHGISRKAIPDDPDDDVLFAGSRRAAGRSATSQDRAGMFTLPPPPAPLVAEASPYAAAPRATAGTPPFAAPPTRTAAGTQPPPIAHKSQITMTAPGAPTMQLYIAPQSVVSLPPLPAAPATSKKLYAIPVGLFVVVVVLVGVYLTGGHKHAAAPVAARDDHAAVAKMEPTPVEVAPVAAAQVEPVVAAAQPAPVAAPVMESAAVVAPTVPVQNDVIAPPTVVPQSAFTAKHEQTVPTVPSVSATPIALPAVPAAVVAAAPAVEAPQAEPAKAKKSRHELAREKRAAKRAAKHAKARVALADKPAKVATASKATAEELGGKSALAITSTSPREVWVDGKNSKRMTPLRVLVKPGKHSVTLFDKDHGTAKTFEVEAKADTTTKISK